MSHAGDASTFVSSLGASRERGEGVAAVGSTIARHCA
jgi:hypothetical protein